MRVKSSAIMNNITTQMNTMVVVNLREAETLDVGISLPECGHQVWETQASEPSSRAASRQN